MATWSRTPRALLSSALLAFALAAAGCASFSSRELPEVPLAAVEQAGRLPAITYEFTQAGSGNFVGGSLPSYSIARVEPIFRRVFVESKCQPERGPLHLDMYFRLTARNPTVTLTLGLFFIVSLGLIPAYGEDELYLEVKVRKDGECVRQYVYVDEVSTWMHWFMLPWAFSNDPQEVGAKVFDNMLLNLVRDLQRDLPGLVPGG